MQSALTPPIVPSFDQAYHIAQLETEKICFKNLEKCTENISYRLSHRQAGKKNILKIWYDV